MFEIALTITYIEELLERKLTEEEHKKLSDHLADCVGSAINHRQLQRISLTRYEGVINN